MQGRRMQLLMRTCVMLLSQMGSNSLQSTDRCPIDNIHIVILTQYSSRGVRLICLKATVGVAGRLQTSSKKCGARSAHSCCAHMPLARSSFFTSISALRISCCNSPNITSSAVHLNASLTKSKAGCGWLAWLPLPPAMLRPCCGARPAALP